MNNKDKSSNVSHETVVEHPQLKRDRALALFLARAHAHRHGKPPPDPTSIGPAAFTKLTPSMSREEKKQNVLAALRTIGVEVKPAASELTGDGTDPTLRTKQRKKPELI